MSWSEQSIWHWDFANLLRGSGQKSALKVKIRVVLCRFNVAASLLTSGLQASSLQSQTVVSIFFQRKACSKRAGLRSACGHIHFEV